MAKGAIIILTTGEPGVGKTYVRCARFLVDRFLIDTASQINKKTGVKTIAGRHISNFPVYPDIVAETVSKKLKCSIDDVKQRIEIIPQDVLEYWTQELSGPWEYFKDFDLQCCHIAIDEIHEFVNKKSSRDYLKKWADWLAQIRHRGCTIEFLTQALNQVPSVITDRAGIRLELVSMATRRDPFFSIPMTDWYEIRAMIQGKYNHSVLECEFKKGVFGFHRRPNHQRKFSLDDKYFKYYNSFSRGITDGGEEKQQEIKQLYEFEKRSSFGLLKWFLYRNLFHFLPRIFIVVLVVWLCFFGGLTKLINGFVFGLTKVSKSQSSISSSNSKVNTITDTSRSEVVIERKQQITTIVKSDTEKLLDELKKREEELGKMQKQLDEFKDKKENYRIVFISDDYVIFSNNLKAKVNYEFIQGVFQGKKIDSIDFENRSVVLSDSSIISM